MSERAATAFATEPPPTPAQRAAIVRDGHTILEAGAGSGKTTTLVDKIVHLLGAERVEGERVARPCELHEIAAITFTRAAAADFKTKLRKRLRMVARWHEEGGDHGEAARWRARVHEVDRAPIGTIHSFCGGVLRDFAFRLGLDPRFSVLDEGEGSLLRDDCARGALRAALDAGNDAALALCTTLGLSGAQTLAARLARDPGGVERTLAAWFADGAPDLDALEARFLELRERFEVSAEVATWHEELDVRAARLAGAALLLARETRARMDARVRGEGSLDFDALVSRTLLALRERADVRAALRRRLRWLFIDEFQDTDQQQLEIAEWIAGLRDGAADAPSLCLVGDPKQSIYRFRGADVSVWRTAVERFAALGVRPIPLTTNFRSRRPIVEYVNATFDGLIGTGAPGVMAEGQEVEFIRLAAHRDLAGDDGIVELVTPEGEIPATADARRRNEARTVGARLRELVDSDGEVIWDDAAAAMRSVRWKDVAILFRARPAMEAYEEELRALGIPCYVAGGSGFFGRREVRDVLLLLQALVDDRDDHAWLGVLRSPFVLVRDETIARFRMRDARAPLSRMLDLELDGPCGDALRRARGWIAELRVLRDRVPAAELILLAVERSGYAAQLLAREGGDLALANVRKFARVAEGRPGEPIGEFLMHVRERAASESRDGDAVLFTADEDVVTLTTVHGAKGLEWPVVVLATLDREVRSARRRDALLFGEGVGAGLRLEALDVDGTKSAAGMYAALAERDELFDVAEEKRVWYVASTRARDRLLLCMDHSACDPPRAKEKRSPKEKGTAKELGRPKVEVRHWLARALTVDDGFFRYGERWSAGETVLAPLVAPARADAALPSLADALSVPEAELEPHRARIAGVANARGVPRRSATELMLLAKDALAYRERYVAGRWERRLFPRDASGAAPTSIEANVLGDVLHGTLERLREIDDLDEWLETELRAATGDGRGSPRVRAGVARLRELVAGAMAHPDVARAYDDPSAARELPFTWFARTAGGVHLVRGAMDVVTMASGAPEILDFKSTAIAAGGEREAAAPYALQCHTYASALHALTGTAPSRFTFVFPASGGSYVETLDEAGLAAGLAELHRLLDAAHAAHTAPGAPTA